jgi:hypothetical protein
MPSTEREDCDICDKTGTRPDFGLGGSVSPHASSDLATFKIPMPFASCFRTLRSVVLSIFGRPSFTPWATARLAESRRMRLASKKEGFAHLLFLPTIADRLLGSPPRLTGMSIRNWAWKRSHLDASSVHSA